MTRNAQEFFLLSPAQSKAAHRVTQGPTKKEVTVTHYSVHALRKGTTRTLLQPTATGMEGGSALLDLSMLLRRARKLDFYVQPPNS